MMTYFQNTFLFTACQMLLNVFFRYDVTAESYLHYNKGIFYQKTDGPCKQLSWEPETGKLRD